MAIAMDKCGCQMVVVTGLALCLGSMVVCYITKNFVIYTVVYGFVNGLGMGCIFIPPYTNIGYFFEKWVGFAAGVAYTGSSVGFLILPPIEQAIINTFKWRAVFIFEGALMLSLLPLVLLLPSMKEIDRRKTTILRRKQLNEDEPISYIYIMKQSVFCIWMLSQFCYGCAQWTLTGMMPKLAKTKYHFSAGGQTFITSFALGSFFGRVSLGYITDLPSASAIVVQATSLAIACAAHLMLNATMDFRTLMGISAVIGIFNNLKFLYLKVALETFENIRYLPFALGSIKMAVGLGHIFGSPILNMIMEASDDDGTNTLYAAAAFFGISAALEFDCYFLKKKTANANRES